MNDRFIGILKDLHRICQKWKFNYSMVVDFPKRTIDMYIEEKKKV